jgi:hypothetical protein
MNFSVFFRQLKWEKEGLCVYAVLKVNLFIALHEAGEPSESSASSFRSADAGSMRRPQMFRVILSLLEVLNS